VGEFVPQAMTELIGSRGVDVIRRIGIDEVKKVIADVLCGVNLRDSTELLTRRRIGMLNAATLVLFLRGLSASKDFLDTLPHVATAGLRNHPSKQERWLLQWLLGLTGKGVQNILRDSHSALEQYRDRFVVTHRDMIRRCAREFGPIAGVIKLDGQQAVEVSWDFLLSIFCAIGSQTLAIRGSEKSTYGKLFERLVLGSVLQMLGFKHVRFPPSETKNVFWFSSRLGARESDAAVLCGPGKAVRFDIGFIGRGNPEISKDKVSRFERQLEVTGEDKKVRKYYCATFVIVDRVGERSEIIEQAKAINGTIVQMSMSYWPKILAKKLYEKTGFRSTLLRVSDGKVDAWLRNKTEKVSIGEFVEVTSGLIAEEKDEA
jgi:hypothetical protein